MQYALICYDLQLILAPMRLGGEGFSALYRWARGAACPRRPRGAALCQRAAAGESLSGRRSSPTFPRRFHCRFQPHMAMWYSWSSYHHTSRCAPVVGLFWEDDAVHREVTMDSEDSGHGVSQSDGRDW